MINMSSRDQAGVIYIRHKGKLIPTTVGCKVYEETYLDYATNYSFDAGWIPVGFEHRPDLISDVLFNSPGYWWLIMQANGITSPFEQLKAGDQVVIPRI